MNRRIAIDLVTIRPGEGGTGSGIWTYASELLQHLDSAGSQGLEIICLINPSQAPFFSNVRSIRQIVFPDFGKHILLRLIWVHLLLPLFCLWHRIGILHKLATETPLFCPARRVTTIHDFYYEFLMENHPPKTIRFYERMENLYFSFITRTCFQKSRALIAVSLATRREAQTRYPSAAGRLYVVHHGAPEIAPVLSRAGGNFNILCVAKFMEHKGQYLLIQAFEALLQKHPDLVGAVRLTLRGFQNDEDYYQRIVQQIADSRWGEYITIIPFSASDRLEAIYQDADMVVLLSSYEGFGLTLLEAQARGVPVICSDLDVLREVGGDGTVYVDRNDARVVADEIHALIRNQDIRSFRIKAGLDNVKRFDWNKTARETLAVYLTAAKKQGK